MRKVWNYRRTRPVAGIMAALCLLLWQAPPAAAFYKPKARLKHGKTQTPDAELKAKIRQKEQAAAREPDVRELSAGEMGEYRGRGAYRNIDFSGRLPWHRSLRDVNLNTGNLFKSFSDIQVSAARGAGLALQRTYNSNDERVGPFGVGWTHAYDIRMNEGGNNNVPRTDFFGGKHTYKRDADGLYSPPSYLFDELSSDYDQFLADGPPEILSDDDRGMDGTVKHFTSGGTDADGTPSGERVIDSITDRHGNQTTFTYGLTLNLGGLATKRLLTRVTDPSGRYLDFTWSNLGTSLAPAYRITMVQGPFDANNAPVYTVTYEYNGDYNLWKVHQDPNGLNRTTTFTYTTVSGESGLLASVADGLGHTVSYSYDLPQYNYTGTVWVTGISEPGSGGTHNWNITPSIPGQQPWPYAVTVSSNGGHSLYMTMHSGLQTAFFQAGNMYLFLTEYDTANNITSRTRQSLIFGPDNYYSTIPSVMEEMTYGPHGNMLTQSFYGFANSTTTTSYYNASKYFQTESVIDPKGNITTYDYFDDQDANPGNRGEVKWVRDARYSATGQQFEYTYNSYGQKLTETNLNDVVTEYTYGDTWGNVTQMVQDPGMGHLNRTTQTTYDVAGRVVASTDPMNQSSSFAYNGAGQPTASTLPDETVSYSYAANGRTASVTDDRGTTTFTYESGNDRIASVTDPVTGTISYTYGLAGERATMTLPGGGTWTYDFNSQVGGRQQILPNDEPDKLAFMLRNIEDDQGRVVSYYSDQYGSVHEARVARSYDGSGSLVGYLDVTYTPETSSGHARGTLAQVKNVWMQYSPMMGGWQSTTLVQNDYTYDDNGNRLTNTLSDNSGPIRTETYGYDALNRLTSVNYGDGTTQGYMFDPMGNRLSKTENGVTESYSYNNANMLLSRGSNGYTNDANGNTLTGGGRTNTWDGQNHLTQCVTSTDTSNFIYGGDGLRHQATVNGTTTDFVLDGQSVVRERQGAYNAATYFQGLRGPEYRRNDSTGIVRWYLYDGLGTVLGELNDSGSITASRKYDVYGSVRGSSGASTSNHKFVGGLGHPSEDGTGLINMAARYYDPVTGRFASEDPAVQGENWFIYARNAPINFADPDGKKEWPVVEKTLFGIGMALASTAALILFFAHAQKQKESVKTRALAVVLSAAAVECFCFSSIGLVNDTMKARVLQGISTVKVMLDMIIAFTEWGGRLSSLPGAAIAVGAAFVYALALTGVLISEGVDVA